MKKIILFLAFFQLHAINAMDEKEPRIISTANTQYDITHLKQHTLSFNEKGIPMIDGHPWLFFLKHENEYAICGGFNAKDVNFKTVPSGKIQFTWEGPKGRQKWEINPTILTSTIGLQCLTAYQKKSKK